MAKVGRKSTINPVEWLKAVKELHSMDDKKVSVKMKVGKSTIWRFRIKIQEDQELRKYYNEAIKFLDGLSETEYTRDLENKDVFKQIPLMKLYRKRLDGRIITERRKDDLISSIRNICKHLKIHPNNITVEDAIQLHGQMKELYYRDEKQPRGIAYSTIRESIRSFFPIMKGIPTDYLSSQGVTKEKLKGSGKFARQRVTQDQRHKLEKILLELGRTDIKYLDALLVDIWMYSTGTRITSSLLINFREIEYSLTKKVWILTITDKGEKGGIVWNKLLTAHLLKKFKEILSLRFNIPFENLETELPNKTDYLFPSFINGNKRVKIEQIRSINKKYLREAGVSYKEFHPNHIFRHTFAQDSLEATDRNYELVGSIGGWKDTKILREHYGEPSDEQRIRGLNRMMGIEVKKIERFLEW